MPLLLALIASVLLLSGDLVGLQLPRIAIPFWLGTAVALYFSIGAVATIFDVRRAFRDLSAKELSAHAPIQAR